MLALSGVELAQVFADLGAFLFAIPLVLPALARMGYEHSAR